MLIFFYTTYIRCKVSSRNRQRSGTITSERVSKVSKIKRSITLRKKALEDALEDASERTLDPAAIRKIKAYIKELDDMHKNKLGFDATLDDIGKVEARLEEIRAKTRKYTLH